MSPFFLPRSLLAAGLLAISIGTLAPAAGAQAQPSRPAADDSDNEKVNMVIIYGNDPCPASTDNEITVCARKNESERYRIPEAFRTAPSTQDQSWTSKVLAYETVGAAGTNSCSPVGAGGWTGCMSKFVKDAYAEKKTSDQVLFSRLIEEARQKRLSTVDADAAKQQAAVEQAEKDYDARQRAQQDPDSTDKPATNTPPTPATTPAP